MCETMQSSHRLRPAMALVRALLAPTASGDGGGEPFCAPLPPSPRLHVSRIEESVFILSSVWSGESWADLERLGEKWWKGLIISGNQAETYLIIMINDTSIGDLPLIITISDTCKNQPKRLDFDNTINLSSLIVILSNRYNTNRKVGTETTVETENIYNVPSSEYVFLLASRRYNLVHRSSLSRR